MQKTNKKQLAFALFEKGFRPGSAEIKALELKGRVPFTYFQKWKRAKEEAGETVAPAAEVEETKEEKGKPGKAAVDKVTPNPSVVGITVGRIVITPENWAMNQYGAVLILDTYNKAKQDLNYGGTIGDFLVDICVFYRRLIGYEKFQEVGNGTTIEGEGGGSIAEDGGNGAGAGSRAAAG